ncbi:zinc finger, CCHC-type containing protein [Tanacetum coccineum]
MLERLAGTEYYYFLDRFSKYFHISIAPEDQEKTTFTCPYETFTYRRMPFGLCNAPAKFQRCMTAILRIAWRCLWMTSLSLEVPSATASKIWNRCLRGSGIEIDKAKIKINELDDMRLDAYESSISYKERMKRWNDKRITMPINYEKGDKNVESVKELWDYLESKYLAEDASSKKFLVNSKLPPSWKDFKHSLKHGKDDLSLVQLGHHLRIEESLKAQKSNNGKGKEVVGPSVNMAEEGGKNKNKKQNKGKKRGFKDNNGGSGSNKKPKLEYWKCGKTGHFKRDCRSGNKKNNASASCWIILQNRS